MHVIISKEISSEGAIIKFDFELDRDDLKETKSTNAGGKNVKLSATSARFYFPFDFDLPHPDLLALSALKIISPYIGSKFSCNIPISETMANAIKRNYKNIKDVSFDKNQTNRLMPEKERPAVSFSGGADSVAAAALLDANTPLILSARRWHPDIGEFEKWYNTESNVQTLDAMPRKYNKVCVYSDFEFLSTNGSYCIYPDSYAFTIPCILLADFYKFSHIITGDILAAFTGDETIFSKNYSIKSNDLFAAAGLSLEPVINGFSEIGSLKIAENFNLLDISTTCQYGKFKKPCMKCIKCFRKSLYAWALFDYKLSEKDLERFNASNSVISFSQNLTRGGLILGPSFKYCFERLSTQFDGAIGIIKNRMISIPLNPSFVDSIYYPAYSVNRPDFTIKSFVKATKLMDLMSDYQIQQFMQLDYRTILNNS